MRWFSVNPLTDLRGFYKYFIHVASGRIILIKENYDNNGQQLLSLLHMLPLYEWVLSNSVVSLMKLSVKKKKSVTLSSDSVIWFFIYLFNLQLQKYSNTLTRQSLLIMCECVNVWMCECVSPWRIKDSRINKFTN